MLAHEVLDFGKKIRTASFLNFPTEKRSTKQALNCMTHAVHALVTKNAKFLENFKIRNGIPQNRSEGSFRNV